MGQCEVSRASASFLDSLTVHVSCHGVGQEGTFPDVQSEGRTDACHMGKPGRFTLLPFNDPAVCGPLFVDQPRTETGNLKLQVENRCANGVKGATCPKYGGCPHRDKFRGLTSFPGN